MNFSMGFKNAWKLVSKELPLLGTNFFFFSLYKVSDSYKGEEMQKTKRIGVIFCYVMKEPLLTLI